MAGITSFGAYIPWHRINRELFSGAWGGFNAPGERSVAYYDEDSLTMAVEAAIDCLGDEDAGKLDGLFFASTTSPYREKQCSPIMAMALDMRRDIRTADFNTSLRSGSIAMAQAVDTVKAGSAGRVMVAMADMRMGGLSGFNEQLIGDGGAAFIIGNDNVIAEIEEIYSISDELTGTWRSQNDVYVCSWEDRMIQDEGYTPVLTEAISGILKKTGLEAKDITKAVVDNPGDPRGHSKLLADLGFTPEQIQEPITMFMNVGFCGCAHAPMMLVSCLETAKPGDKILFAGSGAGADVMIMQVTDNIEKLPKKRGMSQHLAVKQPLERYNAILQWRDLVQIEAARRPEKQHNKISAIWRERKSILSLYGKKCNKCGCIQYDNGANSTGPIRICAECQSLDDFEDYRFADKQGEVFSFTNDQLAPTIDPPSSVVLIDFKEGGRAFFDLTDRVAEDVKIGMGVEMTFRKIHFDRGYVNYFWKARPVRFDN